MTRAAATGGGSSLYVKEQWNLILPIFFRFSNNII